MRHASGTMLFSSGSSSPNGRPYAIPTARRASAPARIAASAAFGPPRRPARGSTPASDLWGSATDEPGDVSGAHDDRVHARPLERDDVLTPVDRDVRDR